MVQNPNRDRGGDVSGTTMTDNKHGVGSGLEVAKASFDPGYAFGMSADNVPDEALKTGYLPESDAIKAGN